MKKVSIAEVICDAWQLKRPELLKGILATDFTWYETPYTEPIKSVDALLKMWESDLTPQSEIKVTSEILSDNSKQCIAHWSAKFVRNGKLEVLDGVFQIKYNDDHKLTEFRQWWVVK